MANVTTAKIALAFVDFLESKGFEIFYPHHQYCMVWTVRMGKGVNGLIRKLPDNTHALDVKLDGLFAEFIATRHDIVIKY